MATPKTRAISHAKSEMFRQYCLWGEQNHTDERWTAILGEEYGEACQAVCDLLEENPGADVCVLYDELIQVAAVALTWASSFWRDSERAHALGYHWSQVQNLKDRSDSR